MLILLTLVVNSGPLTRNRDGSIGKLFPLQTLGNKVIPDGAVTQTINIIRDCRNNNRAARGVIFLKWEYFISVEILITHDLFLWLKIFWVFIHQYFRQEMCLHDAWWGLLSLANMAMGYQLMMFGVYTQPRVSSKRICSTRVLNSRAMNSGPGHKRAPDNGFIKR